MAQMTRFFLSVSVSAILTIILQETTQRDQFPVQPPLIRPLYYFVQNQPPSVAAHNSGDGGRSSGGEFANFDQRFEKNDPINFDDKIPTQPTYGDTAIIMDYDHPMVDDLSRHLWPDLPLIKKKPLHVHHGRGRHALAQLTYDDYMNQMKNSAARKRLDVDALQLDLQGYRDGYGEGWDGDEYWLTDAEIYHSKGYKKYRKHLKKKSKALKKSLKVVKWFQKWMEHKAVKLDVIAPWR